MYIYKETKYWRGASRPASVYSHEIIIIGLICQSLYIYITKFVILIRKIET